MDTFVLSSANNARQPKPHYIFHQNIAYTLTFKYIHSNKTEIMILRLIVRCK